MVKITFKDVGQGDSILIEWLTKTKQLKIGIIDCKSKAGKNPILEHIIKENIKEIDFIVLSHPHTDHYSGMTELLTFCSVNNVRINKFCHTLKDIEIEYWKYLEPNITNSTELFKVFEIVLNSYNKNLQEIIKLDFDYRIYLTDEYYLRCLSPSHFEKAEYISTLGSIPEKNRMKRSRVANLLSTLFKLKLDDKFVLFTSDVEKITFQRITQKNLDLFTDKTNLLSQIPHHGSETNHEPSFWSALNKTSQCCAMVSAGEHKSYNHPHYEVVNYFYSLGYNVESTNIINGMKKHVLDIQLRSLALDSDSLIAEEFYVSGDKVYEF